MTCTFLYETGQAEHLSSVLASSWILRGLVEFVMCRCLIEFVLYRQVIAIWHRPVGGEFTEYLRVRNIAMTCCVYDVQITYCICAISTSDCYIT